MILNKLNLKTNSDKGMIIKYIIKPVVFFTNKLFFKKTVFFRGFRGVLLLVFLITVVTFFQRDVWPTLKVGNNI